MYADVFRDRYVLDVESEFDAGSCWRSFIVGGVECLWRSVEFGNCGLAETLLGEPALAGMTRNIRR